MANKIIGRLFRIGDIQEIPTRSGQPFRKREVIIDASRTDPYTLAKTENYPSVEFCGKHVDDVNGFNVGEAVVVSFYVSGRAYNNGGVQKYFNSIQGIGIDRYAAAPQPQPVQPQPQQWTQPQPVQPQPQPAVYYPEQRNGQQAAPVNTDNLPF